MGARQTEQSVIQFDERGAAGMSAVERIEVVHGATPF